MAIQSRSLASAEHDFFFSNAPNSPPPSTPLGDVKRAFYAFYVGGVTARKSLVELEKEYLRNYTGTATNSLPDLWREFVGLFGIDATKKSLDQIQYEFFIKNQPEP